MSAEALICMQHNTLSDAHNHACSPTYMRIAVSLTCKDIFFTAVTYVRRDAWLCGLVHGAAILVGRWLATAIFLHDFYEHFFLTGHACNWAHIYRLVNGKLMCKCNWSRQAAFFHSRISTRPRLNPAVKARLKPLEQRPCKDTCNAFQSRNVV